MKIYYQQEIESITPEQWEKIPTWLKWKIAIILTWYVIPFWLAVLGLKIGTRVFAWKKCGL